MFERIMVDPFVVTPENKEAYSKLKAMTYKQAGPAVIFLSGEKMTGKSHMVRVLSEQSGQCEVHIFEAALVDTYMFEQRLRSNRISWQQSVGILKKETDIGVTPTYTKDRLLVLENFDEVHPSIISKKEWSLLFRNNRKIIITSRLRLDKLAPYQQDLLKDTELQEVEILLMSIESKKIILQEFCRAIGYDALYPEVSTVLLELFDLDQAKEFAYRIFPKINGRIRLKKQTLPRLLRTDPVLGDKGKEYAAHAIRLFAGEEE